MNETEQLREASALVGEARDILASLGTVDGLVESLGRVQRGIANRAGDVLAAEAER